MLRSGFSKLSSQVSQSRIKSNFSVAKSRITSAIDRFNEYQTEKQELRKKLPCLLRSLQYFLSMVNFCLFVIYVAFFGASIALALTAYMEDCLKSISTPEYVPERVTPNMVGGYNCTGYRLFEKDDHFQISLLTLFVIAMGLQMISANLAFVGSITLTTKNIKMYFYLFFLSTILLIVFCVFDVSPLKRGKQYLKYFGIFNTTILIFILTVAISHVFSGFFSVVLLLQWANFVNDVNRVL